jgi:hypothetical protein
MLLRPPGKKVHGHRILVLRRYVPLILCETVTERPTTVSLLVMWSGNNIPLDLTYHRHRKLVQLMHSWRRVVLLGSRAIREVLSAAAEDAHSCFKACVAVCISWSLACHASSLVARRRKTCTRQLGSPVYVFLGMAADRAVSWMRDPADVLTDGVFGPIYFSRGGNDDR